MDYYRAPNSAADAGMIPGDPQYRHRGYLAEGPPRLPDADLVNHDPPKPMTEYERKVIIEFCHLLEKSKQLFNGLRDLPPYGHRQWYSYFGRTFDVYTKLWKFQQQYRFVLDDKYGLKRWQIGEIASKIGQLYYHFYLRTSEMAYLNEAYSFYHAIRGRSYYTRAVAQDRSDLMVKQLRYYARFIVVCLLMKKMKLVNELIRELDHQILDYGKVYDPEDQLEWGVVSEEVKAFVKAEPVIVIAESDGYPVVLTHRLNDRFIPPVEKLQIMNLELQEIVIIGSRSDQVKFSELTVDMYRILQTLERDDEEYLDIFQFSRCFPPSSHGKEYYGSGIHQYRENAHKYLLYKPSVSQVLVYLASGCKDLLYNGALLLYMSADGHFVPPTKNPEDVGYDVGGVITGVKRDVYRDAPRDPRVPPKYKEIACLHPGDIYPFTRRPLFIIVDSENSFVYQNIPRHFGQPMVIFMSPVELPYRDLQRNGSLFTLFLHSPLAAFCFCCDIPTLSTTEWDRAQSYVDKFLNDASWLLSRSRATDQSYLSFLGDDFFRILIVRYVFCELVLRMHVNFSNQTNLPRASPPLPEAEVMEQNALQHCVWDLITYLDVRQYFSQAAGAGPAPSSSSGPAPPPSGGAPAAGTSSASSAPAAAPSKSRE